MILVTVGTNEQPFDRLVRGRGGARRATSRCSSSTARRRCRTARGEWVDFLPFDELERAAAQARGWSSATPGVGSIMLARRCGHAPDRGAAPPRSSARPSTTISCTLARRLARAGLVTLVEDEPALRMALGAPVGAADDVPARRVRGADTLSADVRDVLEGLGAAPVSGRAA